MIIFKYLLKNLTEKKGRTFLLVFSMFICSLVGLIGLELVTKSSVVADVIMRDSSGDADFVIVDQNGHREPLALSVPNEQVLVFSSSAGEFKYFESEYAYFGEDAFSIMSMDYEAAGNMNLLPKGIVLGDKETAVAEGFADAFGYGEGDTITLYDNDKNPYEFTITGILDKKALSGKVSQTIFLNFDDFKLISSAGEHASHMIYVDVLNDADRERAAGELETICYNAEITNLADSETVKQMQEFLSQIFGVMFAVTFLLVAFVAFSMTNRIVSERMAVIGTFRSLGMSPTFSLRVLLMETMLYGFIGSGLAILVYSGIRSVFLRVLFLLTKIVGDPSAAKDASEELVATFMDLDVTRFGSLSPLICLAVVLFSVAVMLACPVKEALRTSKMAIRDIIFDNKDTEYRMGKGSKITGLICIVLFIVTFVFWKIKRNVVVEVGCFAAGIIAIAMLFPMLLQGISLCLANFFEKRNRPVERLAALEMYAKKSTVGNAVLCVSASALAMTLLIGGTTDMNIYGNRYSTDIYVEPVSGTKVEYFSYIKDLDSVESVEYTYIKSSSEAIIGENDESAFDIIGIPEEGYEQMVGITDCPQLSTDEYFATDKETADTYKLKRGDRVELTFESDSFLPIKKTLIFAGAADFSNYSPVISGILITKDLYISIYHDTPTNILIKSTDPDSVVNTIRFYSNGVTSQVMRLEDYLRIQGVTFGTLQGPAVAGAILGILLSLIGMFSNQVIGFEGRRRESAMLASVAMRRDQVARMFFVESALVALASVIIAFPASLLLYLPVNQAMFGLPVSYKWGTLLLFALLLWVVFSLVALTPLKRIRNMKIAEQLKYE